MASECNKPQPACKLLFRYKVVSICFCLIYFQTEQRSFARWPLVSLMSVSWVCTCRYSFSQVQCVPTKWILALFKNMRWEWMLLFMNTLSELMLSYVLSYSVKYTVVWIQTGNSSCSGDSMIWSLVGPAPFCRRWVVVLGEGKLHLFVPTSALSCNSKIWFTLSQCIKSMLTHVWVSWYWWIPPVPECFWWCLRQISRRA